MGCGDIGRAIYYYSLNGRTFHLFVEAGAVGS